MKSSKKSTSSIEDDNTQDGKDSPLSNDKPKPLTRACESCRLRKTRCLPHESSSCQRCAKAGRECVFTFPEKRQKRKRTDTRVAELEHTVQVLALKLEHEQRARLEQDEHIRRYSDNQRAMSLNSAFSRASDISESSRPRQESLRHPASLNTRELSLAGSSSYTSGSPSDFSTSEEYDTLSRPPTTPSPHSVLASTEIVSPTFVNYQFPGAQHGNPGWPTSNPYHSLSPQQSSQSNPLYISDYSLPVNTSPTVPQPPLIQPSPMQGVSPSHPALSNIFSPTITGNYSSSTPSNTSAPLQVQSTWCSEPSNTYPVYPNHPPVGMYDTYSRQQQEQQQQHHHHRPHHR